MSKINRKEIYKTIHEVRKIATIAIRCMEKHSDLAQEVIPPRRLIKPIEMKNKNKKTCKR
jgi:hypothetical protein